MLGPCDGPPPDAVRDAARQQPADRRPTARSRRSRRTRRRSCARSGRCATRHFDVVHLHEPLVPGPTMTALLCSRRPSSPRSTPPATAPAYRLSRAGAPCAGRATSTCAVAVSKDARELADAAPRRRLRGAVQRRRDRPLRDADAAADRRRRRSSSAAATSSARASTCCSRRGQRCPATCGCGSAATARTPSALRARYGGDRASSGSAGSPTTRSRPAARAPTCSARRRCAASRSAWCCSRRWRPARRSWPATSPATATWPPTASTRCSSQPGDAAALADALRRVLGDDAPSATGCVAAGDRRAPRSSRWTASPTRYLEIYRDASSAASRSQRADRARRPRGVSLGARRLGVSRRMSR